MMPGRGERRPVPAGKERPGLWIAGRRAGIIMGMHGLPARGIRLRPRGPAPYRWRAPRWLALALLGWASAATAQSMYRCQDAEGRTAFQQMPCEPGQGERIEVRPVTTEMGRNILERAARNARGELTEDELLARLGPPTTLNTDVVDGEVFRQYVYRRPQGTQVYYTRDGIVRASQDRPRPPRPAAAPCPGRQEIANARTSASSIILSPAEKQAALDRVRDMERCRH
jgi:Domain of unknown function (DUF4124)